MDSKQFHMRLHGIVGLMILMFLLFFAILYDLQVVNGGEYREQSTRSITSKETVEAVRGELLDCNGRALVSNRATYQVTLNVPSMGKEAERNAILLQLLDLCRENGVEWTDTLPISRTAPYVYTMKEATGSARRGFIRLMERFGENSDSWRTAAASGIQLARAWQSYYSAETPGPTPTGSVDASELMEKMTEYFALDPDLTPVEVRDLLGVLYEVNLRTKEAVSSEYIFARDVDIGFITAVKELGLKGVRVETTTVREYETSYAAHLLGRVGAIQAEQWDYYADKGYQMNDTVGIDGLEKAFEPYLRGEAGVKIIESNSAGKAINETWDVDEETGETMEPKPGGQVSITMDLRLQEILERSLAERIPTLTDQVKGGAGVVVDMKGGVKAIASYPTYDLVNLYNDKDLYKATTEDPLTPMVNRALQGLYSPGSTFKMITGVAALQEGKTTATEKILDTGRFRYPKGEKYPYGDYHPACWKFLQYGGTHGWEDMGHALMDSCNIFFYTLGDRLGIDALNEYAAMFGLGRKTGIELPEETGYVASPETSERLGQNWYGGNLLSASIGQGNTLCTPVQLANYIATLVNGGDHYPVHLLQSVKSNDFSEVLLENEPEPLNSIDISPENLEAVKKGMGLLVTEGSVKKYFKDLPVTAGAKTGTAQVGSETAEANAVFVCFAPYDDPEIAIALVAERGGSGTELAAVAADVLAAYFDQDTTVEAVPGEGTLLR